MMAKRLRTLGVVLALVGLGFMIAGGVAYTKVQDGYGSLQAFSEAQNVTLSYNDDGQLVDRGTTEGRRSDHDAADGGLELPGRRGRPRLRTIRWSTPASEYMYQMATICLPRAPRHPDDRPGRRRRVQRRDCSPPAPTSSTSTAATGPTSTACTRSRARLAVRHGRGTAHGLVAELGVGTVTHSALQMGLGLAALLAGVGFTALIAGAGLWWAGREEKEVVPDTIPADWDKKTTNV